MLRIPIHRFFFELHFVLASLLSLIFCMLLFLSVSTKGEEVPIDGQGQNGVTSAKGGVGEQQTATESSIVAAKNALDKEEDGASETWPGKSVGKT